MIVLLLITVIGSIINSRNHLEDKGQETSGYPYPLPPPLGVVFLPHVTYNGGGDLYLVAIWEGSVYVSTGYLYIGWDSSGGYLFFIKFL